MSMVGCIYSPLDDRNGINCEGEVHVLSYLQVLHAAHKLAPIILISFPDT